MPPANVCQSLSLGYAAYWNRKNVGAGGGRLLALAHTKVWVVGEEFNYIQNAGVLFVDYGEICWMGQKVLT